LLWIKRHGTTGLIRKINDDVNKIISQHDGHWNINYIGINPKLTAAQGNRLPGYFRNQTHPSAKGAEVRAASLVPEFEKVLEKQSVAKAM
jgi:lysophospholipase L1-like esterase